MLLGQSNGRQWIELRRRFWARTIFWDGAAEIVIPHMLVQDDATQETDASRSGLNYASATGDSIPNLGEQKLSALDTRRKLVGNFVSGGTSGSGTRLGQAHVQLWTHGGFRRRRLLRG